MSGGPAGLSRLARLVLVAGAVLLADQASKLWAVDRLTRAHELGGHTGVVGLVKGYFVEQELELKRDRPIVVVRDHWSFKYVENPGAAWGLFGQLPDGLRVPFFHVLSFVALGFILAFWRRLHETQVLLQTALALVFGGALGNWFDRLVRGYVIDFIDWHWKNEAALHWPTFNVADVGISAGVALMLAETLLYKRAARPVAGDEPATPGRSTPDAA